MPDTLATSSGAVAKYFQNMLKNNGVSAAENATEERNSPGSAFMYVEKTSVHYQYGN